MLEGIRSKADREQAGLRCVRQVAVDWLCLSLAVVTEYHKALPHRPAPARNTLLLPSHICLLARCCVFLPSPLAQIKLFLHFPEAKKNEALGGSPPLAQISRSICE